MYFSIHCVKHVDSPLCYVHTKSVFGSCTCMCSWDGWIELTVNDAPGLGTHFSKQCSFTFFELSVLRIVREGIGAKKMGHEAQNVHQSTA